MTENASAKQNVDALHRASGETYDPAKEGHLKTGQWELRLSGVVRWNRMAFRR